MDALVKLYELPDSEEVISTLSKDNIIIRHAMSYEKTAIQDWVRTNFTQNWSDECTAAFNLQPVSCLIAVKNGNILGFACYECTQKNFFGPMGVADQARNTGIGKALLLESLQSMRELGYAYAIIGGCDGMETFYRHTINAQPIQNSSPGIYTNRLKSN